MDLKSQIDSEKIPKHIAIIMDGNGRWAKEHGKARIFGHKNAIQAVRETVEAAAELGVGNLTLYAFSTENWNRPKLEVQALMELLVNTINKELGTLTKNNIRLLAIGNLDSLPSSCKKGLKKAIEATKNNERMNLILALSYSARWEIIKAVKDIADKVESGHLHKEEIDEELFTQHLATANFPDPELMIRTSGEYRISNFLLWQLAYTELSFINKYWPDFRKEDLYQAIIDYQKRERRFGKISEQVQA
ncbi:MAG: isoprenyl transferase [Crocinitomicaceae bacterium]|nr:isoprenyl transferase [Crocinitomicaceae bacterium]|tara:strand:- start:1565 stop:2308 length:744 start_codon:yes stop_codon:yes gene_type:complete